MTTPAEKLRLLIVEDDDGDSLLIRYMLSDSGVQDFDVENRKTLAAGIERLGQGGIDLVLLDLGLPDSVGIGTFQKLHYLYPDTPVIMMTGLNDQDIAVRALNEGAQDYIVKGEVQSDTLSRAIRYAIERQKLLVSLEHALHEVKTLKNLLPICSGCKSIRDDKGYWQAVEKYFGEHTDVAFSHGLCPDCAKRMYPEYFKQDEDLEEK